MAQSRACDAYDEQRVEVVYAVAVTRKVVGGRTGFLLVLARKVRIIWVGRWGIGFVQDQDWRV
ncbi:MAG TPA: hypothetical protein VMW16_08915 [Sedimentisphaerales bacterium]|nr:hypothetical protein [Sedimentisphaerales bacterium]